MPMPSFAQQSGADKCQARINKALDSELRQYRAILFGVKPAADAPVGDIRYNFITGEPWIKKANGEWTNSKGDTADNDEIDDTSDTAHLLQTNSSGNKTARPGIFETKRVLTSTLIPYLLQNIRALDCNASRICMQTQFSLRQTGSTVVPIDELQPLGCIKFTNLVTFADCHLAEGEVNDMSNVITYCSEVSNQMLSRESALLKLAVEYDAGYRSTLQFAGMFDLFLEELRWPMTGSIRQAASLVGQLNRIPCFLSSCDESPVLNP